MSPTPISIRRAAVQDLPVVVAIEQTAPVAAHWTAEQYQRRLNDGCLIVAEQERKICGFLCARVVAGEWEIENVVVAPSFRRLGVGDRLMRAIIQESTGRAASRILLDVRETNLPARRLYEKHGFREVGRRPGYYSNPADDAILYDRGGAL